MTTRYNCRLQVAILSLALYVLLLPGYAKADFKVSMTGVKGATNLVKFPKVPEILSVTSPYPNLITGHPLNSTKRTNTITYNDKLPQNCPIPVTITGRDENGNFVRYTGHVTYNPLNPAVLPEAVGVRGDQAKLDALIADLSATHTVQVVSRRDAPPPQGNQEVAIVLLDKGNSSNHLTRVSTADIIQNAIDKKPDLSTIKQMTGNCGPSCVDTCDAVLQLDGSANNDVLTAIVKTPNDIVNVNVPTKWDSKCVKNPLGACSPTSPKTCYNGGLCDISRTNSPHICTCNPQTNLYGPRCQLLTRSYEGTSTDNYVSSHKLFNDGHIQPQTFSFSFEHAGKCQLASGLCSIIVVEASGKTLLKVEEGTSSNTIYDTATLPANEPDEMALYSDRMVQNNRWMEVTVHVAMQGNNLKATTVFCTKEASPVCVEKKLEKVGVIDKTKEAQLTLGGKVRGCFRNLRFYGDLVDLKLATPVAGTKEGCDQQSSSCSSKCGDGDANSVCYGMLGSSATLPCSCKCSSSKRMPAERITLATQCSAQCTTESPIINIAGSGTLNWKGTSSASIPLDPQAPLTVSFLMRTKQAVASEVLKVVGNSITLSIKLGADKYLSACISGNCYPFSSVPANDGKWHEIFVMVAKTQLTVRLGDYNRVYIITSNQPISEATASMQLVDGCIRDVRLSGVYMPASGSDKTEEKDSSNSVKLDVSGSVTAGSTCTASK